LVLEKLEWRGYQMVKTCEDIFIRFDRIHERDRRDRLSLSSFRGIYMSSRLQVDVRNLSLGRRHLVNAYEVKAGMVYFAGETA